jgi:hypothetical protein
MPDWRPVVSGEPTDRSEKPALTIDAIDAWLVACEELLATAGDHEDDATYTKGKAIRYVVATAAARVTDIVEGLDR